MLPQKNIVQNTAFLTAALILQKVIAYIFFLALARLLGASGTGEYVAAFSLTGLFSVFVDLGLSNVLVREIARAPHEAHRYFRNVLGLKLVLGCATFVGLMLIVFLLDFFNASHPSFELIAIAGVVMLVDSLVLSATSVFRGWHNLAYESWAVVVQKVGVLVVGLLVLFAMPSPVNVAMGVLLGGIGGYWLVVTYLKQGFSAPLLPEFDWEVQRSLLLMAWPFAIAGFFAMGYSYFDSIILSVVKGSESVGLYSVASKTMNAFVFIPAAFVAGLYPAMSAAQHDAPRVKELLQIGLRYLLLIGVPMSAGLYVLADQFVSMLGPGYSDAVVAVRILLPSLPLMFLTYPIGSLLNATGRQSTQTAILGFGLLVNISLNVWLIPQYSYVGASVAWSVANVVMLAVGCAVVWRLINVLPLLLTVVRVMLSVIVMVVGLEWLAEALLPVQILFGGVLYISVLFITKEIIRSDISRMLKLVRYGQ